VLLRVDEGLLLFSIFIMRKLSYRDSGGTAECFGTGEKATFWAIFGRFWTHFPRLTVDLQLLLQYATAVMVQKIYLSHSICFESTGAV